MVENVESLRPELIFEFLSENRAVLVQAGIPNPESRSKQRVSSRVPQGSCSGKGIACGIIKLRLGSRPSVGIAAGNKFSVYSVVNTHSRRIGSLVGYGVDAAAPVDENAAQFPASQDSARKIVLVLEKRQAVHVTGGEVVMLQPVRISPVIARVVVIYDRGLQLRANIVGIGVGVYGGEHQILGHAAPCAGLQRVIGGISIVDLIGKGAVGKARVRHNSLNLGDVGVEYVRRTGGTSSQRSTAGSECSGLHFVQVFEHGEVASLRTHITHFNQGILREHVLRTEMKTVDHWKWGAEVLTGDGNRRLLIAQAGRHRSGRKHCTCAGTPTARRA